MSDEATQTSDIPVHPEEIKLTSELRLGKSISLQSSARITPAGIVTIGLTISLVAVCFSLLSRWRQPY
jgi:hypothetical protein